MSQLLEINGCPDYMGSGMGTGTFKVPGNYPGRPGVSRYLPQRVTLGRPPRPVSVIEEVMSRRNTSKPYPKKQRQSGKRSNPNEYLSIAIAHAKQRRARQAIQFARMAAMTGSSTQKNTANAILNWINTGLNLKTF